MITFITQERVKALNILFKVSITFLWYVMPMVHGHWYVMFQSCFNFIN